MFGGAFFVSAPSTLNYGSQPCFVLGLGSCHYLHPYNRSDNRWTIGVDRPSGAIHKDRLTATRMPVAHCFYASGLLRVRGKKPRQP